MEVTEELLTNKNKALALYKYLKEFCALDSRVITHIQGYGWKLFFDDIPDDNENINPQNNNQFFIGNNYSPLISQLDSKYIFYNFFY